MIRMEANDWREAQQSGKLGAVVGRPETPPEPAGRRRGATQR